ncbi:MAG TPA: biotin/lipoyl-containing protein [Anaerolineaceae bacterium]|nr:biotin/lipoyl-containing protein [Anaerolineaceae bacterium]
MKLKVKVNDETYEVEVGDLDSRPIQATIEGETFEVWPEETVVAAPAAVASAPAPAPAPRVAAPVVAAPVVATASGANAIVAPLPGTVVKILVKEGGQVTQGQEVVSLEAMKMKNAIRAPRAGKVTAILVSEGSQVKHGQPLIEIGD